MGRELLLIRASASLPCSFMPPASFSLVGSPLSLGCLNLYFFSPLRRQRDLRGECKKQLSKGQVPASAESLCFGQARGGRARRPCCTPISAAAGRAKGPNQMPSPPRFSSSRPQSTLAQAWSYRTMSVVLITVSAPAIFAPTEAWARRAGHQRAQASGDTHTGQKDLLSGQTGA